MRLGPLLRNNKTKCIILGIHLLPDHVISVPVPHLALTDITWSSDFPLYLWLYLIYKHHTLDIQFHIASDLIFFVGNCDLYFMVQRFCLGRHHTLGTCSV